MSNERPHRVPLVVKIAPDLTDAAVRGIARLLVAHGIEGVIATNTTIARDGVAGLAHAEETGGLSGAPLADRATAVVRVLADELRGALPIIGVGGVDSAAQARAKRMSSTDVGIGRLLPPILPADPTGSSRCAPSAYECGA